MAGGAENSIRGGRETLISTSARVKPGKKNTCPIAKNIIPNHAFLILSSPVP
jgi:hypothetical protein